MSNGDGGMSTSQSVVNEPDLLRGPGTHSKVTSSFCSADKPQCVQVEYSDDGSGYPIVVTDSKPEDDHSFLRFSREEWDAFVAGVKSGEFDYDVLVTARSVPTKPESAMASADRIMSEASELI